MANRRETMETVTDLIFLESKKIKAGLKLNIQKNEGHGSGPISSWQIDGETMEKVIYFIFLGSKITADGD